MGTLKINPALIHEVRKHGQFDASGCFNCGSCTVTCSLSDDLAPFPRRVIRYVHYGLKEPLITSLEPWLCYYCGDCARTCPRQAEPAESMMTLRRYLTSQYDWTGIASRLYTSAGWRIGANLAAGFMVVLLILFYHLYFEGLAMSDFISMPMGMGHMFEIIIYFTVLVFSIPAVLLITNAFQMYRSTMGSGDIEIPLSFYAGELKTLFLHVFTQKRFGGCEDKTRWIKHLLLFSGFVLISMLTIFFLRWFQTDGIYPVYHPQRWLGYIAAAALIYGSVEILTGRIRRREQMHRFSDLNDWILPVMILLTATSGITIHISRYLEFSLTAHFMYVVHMAVVTPMLVIEIPFGKLSHILYRPLAIYFKAVKEKAIKQQMTGETKPS
jgi:ferredoxin